jgi:hypothetical protein
VDHGDDQAPEAGVQNLLELGSGIRSPGGNVLLLQLAKESLDPAFELAFQFSAVDDEDNRGVPKPLLLFENELGRSQ